MDRRKSLRIMALGGLSATVLVDACKTDTKKPVEQAKDKDSTNLSINRMREEAEAHKKLIAEQFFTASEMATIATLCDIIIPRDAVSGSATDAKVPDFIEFMVKEKPEMQIPLRGGLRWLDLESVKQFGKSFTGSSAQQQIQLVDQIAYPNKAKPEMKQGVSFFNLMRNLTASGFYTSQIGVKDIGYMGNVPNKWQGVPDDVLKQYGLSYTEKEMKECI